MKEFVIGLFVILMMGVVAVLGVLLLPLLLVLSFFLRFLVGLVAFLLVIWLVGKVTLLSIEYMRRPRV